MSNVKGLALISMLVGCGLDTGGGHSYVSVPSECNDVCRKTNGQDGIYLCHAPPGNPDNVQTLCIGRPAINGHLENHDGDFCGTCPPVEEPEVDAGIHEVEPDASIPEEPTPDAGPFLRCEITCGSLECPQDMFCNSVACCEPFVFE